MQQKALVEFPDAKFRELKGFDFFQRRTSRELSHHFDFGFWQTLVLQLSQSEPLILHAVIALGTLHENEEGLGMPLSTDRMSLLNHRFAVAQYNTSIKLLIEHAKDKSKDDIRLVTLATCLVFIHIEFLRGRYESAISHLRSGISILSDVVQGVKHQEIERTIATAFSRLDIQCAHFDKSAPFLSYPCGDPGQFEDANCLATFASLGEAKTQYDRLLGSTLQLIRICDEEVERGGRSHISNAVLILRRKNLLDLHRHYIRLIDSFSQYPDKTSDRKVAEAALFLQMQLRLTYILLSVCMAEDTERAFDAHIAEFSRIVALAKSLIYSESNEQNVPIYNRLTYSTDWGVLPPLTFTALKCRDRDIRREATALLAAWPHREGFWDSALAVQLARQVVSAEENGLADRAVGTCCRRITQVSLKLIDNTDSRHGVASREWADSELYPTKEY